MPSNRIVIMSWLAATSALATFAADGPDSPPATADPEAAYTQALEKRAAGVVDVLKLDDDAKARRVREAVISQYRGLRRLHDDRDATIKSLRAQPDTDKANLEQRIKAERARTDAAARALHERFLATLSTDLSPAQIDQVKDTMTYNKLQVTYHAYLEMLPDLNPEQKQTVFRMLKDAREVATYAGSSEEKSEVFNTYKGRINNYLTGQGYDLKVASKQWAERRKPEK